MAAAGGAGPLRVLLVDLAIDTWGAERVALELAPRLRDRSIEMQLASPSGPFAQTWVELGLVHHRLDVPRHTSIRTGTGGRSPLTLAREAVVALRSAARIAKLARDVDVLHSNHLFSHLETVLAGRLARRPTIIHLHDFVRPGLGRRMLQLAGRRAAAVVVAARAIADRVGLTDGSNVEVLHPALDLDAVSPGPPDAATRAELGARGPDDVLVAVLGRLDHVKGVDLVIRAMADQDPRVRLAVIGGALGASAREVAELERLGEELLGDRVRFLPQRTDVVRVLRSIDILVNDARDEPFGTSILEGQACARAVIASDVGGQGEHVTHRSTGMLIPPEDVPALSEAIAELAADADLRAELGAAGREMVTASYDVRTAASRLAQLYAQVTGPPR